MRTCIYLSSRVPEDRAARSRSRGGSAQEESWGAKVGGGRLAKHLPFRAGARLPLPVHPLPQSRSQSRARPACAPPEAAGAAPTPSCFALIW